MLNSLQSNSPILQFLNLQNTKQTSVSHFKSFKEELLKLLQQRFNAEVDVYELISLNTCIIDELLKNIWGLHKFPDDDAALVAIGGYGRRELFPGSDIDLMIVLNENASEEIESKVKEFLTFLWDINLPIAQSVRTIKDCANEAKNDIAVMTSLMELHYLSGSKDLYQQIKKITDSNKIWPGKKYFKEKINELNDRHRKYGDTANHLEPNVKENLGSLRDLHTLQWLTNRHFKTKHFEELVDKEFLTKTELELLKKTYRILAKIRFALHLYTERSEDRLLFDYQYDVAALLGFHNDNRNLQVEEFMQVFYRTSNQVSTLVEILIKRLRSTMFPGLLRRRAKPINERFQARGNQLEATNTNIFNATPSAILELFYILQQHPYLTEPSDELIQLILNHLHLIDAQFRSAAQNRNYFIKILSQPQTNFREIRRMAQLGVLGKYWPSFDAVTGRMQFDLYHIYTVEEHTLRVFENACQFSQSTSDDEHEAYHDIFTQTPKALLLYLAALFHDIGKGQGIDHSELGAEKAKAFCLHHNLSAFDSNLVSWLVKNHLVMSMTAQHHDLDDPEVVMKFAENVGNLIRLNYLYLLTIADMRGTNQKLWNSWRSSLLSNLYHTTSRYLRRGLDSPIKREELINEVKQSALDKLIGQGVEKSSCLVFWQELEESYFLRHSDEEVVRQTQAIVQCKPHDGAIVNIHQFSARGATEIFIYCNDRNYLFAHITSTLTELRLVIVHARIITSKKGHALDTFLVLDANGNPINDNNQCELVANRLTEKLEHPSDILIAPTQSLPRIIRELRVPIEIQFDLNQNNTHTIMELKAPDFHGLLACIGSAFVDCNIAVHDARISKLGERVHNIFQLSDLENNPLNTQQQNKLETIILQYLQQPKQIPLSV